MNVSASVNFIADRITVATRTKMFFMTKPQSSVIPFLLDGRMTAERGFLVFYSTTDEDILQALHNALCDEVRCGNYRTMLELVMRSQSPFVQEADLTQYVIGFKR